MNIGEEKDIQVTFPEEYHSDDLKGKDAVFKVKLNSLKTVITSYSIHYTKLYELSVNQIKKCGYYF